MIVFWAILVLLLLYFGFGVWVAFSYLHRKAEQKPLPNELLPYKEDVAKKEKELRAKGLTDVYRTANRYRLHAEYLPCPNTKKAVLLVHGMDGWTKDRYLDTDFYLNRGYALLMPDLRGHGGSEGHWTGMGQYERTDLLVWFDFLKEQLGPDCSVVMDGWSMGAASALLIASDGNAENLAAAVADCGFSDTKEEIVYVLSLSKVPAFFYFPVRVMTFLLAGYDLSKSSPRSVLDRCRVPVLFLHGDKDKVVPVEMSQKMYERCSSEKELCIIPDARHCAARLTDRVHCETVLENFLNKYVKN